jgi:hypothetical protein
MGIFGFLSKAHNDQNLVSGDVQSKIAIYDEKIKTAKENIEADRKQLKQMDEAVDQILARSTTEGGADKANIVRKSQQRDRASLTKDIETNQKLVAQLNDEAAPIRAEVRKVDAEVGPIKYIAAFIYGTTPDASMLERAVTWIIILIVIVFDPLAVIMLLASQMTFGWAKEQKESEEEIPLLHKTVEHTEVPVVEPAPIVVTEPELEPIEEYVPTIAELDSFVGDKPTEEELAEISELEKWNKMIEEAEKEVLAQQTSTVEERVAKGETYINTEGEEITATDLEVDLPEDPSKKKSYMTKDPAGRVQVINLK